MVLVTIDSQIHTEEVFQLLPDQVTSALQSFCFSVCRAYVIIILTSSGITALAQALHHLSIAFSKGFPQTNTDVFIGFFFLFLLFFFCFIFLFNNCHRDYKSDPLIRCQIQNVVYQLQVTKTNSNIQQQTFALRPEIICKHNISRGRSV